MRRILIANRGEIARRVIRTAHAMGIETVAVHSEADARAPHVREATYAVLIGPAPAAESYLDIARIMDAVRRSGADAIHPGYGFLSENADFAEACTMAGVTFIGPSIGAMRAMSLKDAAKRTVRNAGVPVVPGYQGDDQTLDRLTRSAAALGYPILIKAVAGGGGKGMRRVDEPVQFADALLSCQREAQRAFGNDQVLIEKFIARPRHVEIQIFGDTHGSVVHLYERDCSVQRRHQKIIEEAPAPGLPDALRAAMGQAAVQAARAIGYVGAGTVEFIVDTSAGMDGPDGKGAPFYFMEMNTRLQVEHPVTEMITGVDLVEWQIRTARGEPLPLTQDRIALRGHAIEARLYAEDADNGFLPSTGTLDPLVFPPVRSGVRVDAGVEQGGAVTIHYDPMIAKLIGHGPDRNSAIEKLTWALDHTIVEGPVTNRAFLARVLGHDSFRRGEIDTGFIDQHLDSLRPLTDVPDRVLALAALALLTERPEAEAARLASPSPWTALGAWRVNLPQRRRLEFVTNAGPLQVLEATRTADGWRIDGLARPIAGRGRWRDSLQFEADYDGDLVRAVVLVRHDAVEVRVWGQTLVIGLGKARAEQSEPQARDGKIRAPMSGKVLAVHVRKGQYVEAGARLLVLEAMKMEHRLAAPAAGTITAVHAADGEQISEGSLLVEIDLDESAR